MSKFIRIALASALAAGLTLAVPAFAQSDGKPLAQQVDLSGASLTVGSKEFTEQQILGNMTLQLLEAAGAEVTDETGLAGSNSVRQALLSGKIDMYWEYTGTAWISYLGHTGESAEGKLYKQVAEEDLQENAIEWLEPAEFSNSYAIATNRQTAEEHGLETLADVGALIESNPDAATLCVGAEFSQRDDGLPGLQQAYGWAFPQENISVLQDALVYQQTAAGQRCNFGSVFATDGRIPNLDLVLLEDDRGFFAPYFAALTVREDILKQYPQLTELFGPVSKALTVDVMQKLNAQVDVDGDFTEQVARQFLTEHNFIAE